METDTYRNLIRFFAILLAVLYGLTACGRADEEDTGNMRPMTPFVQQFLQESTRALQQHEFVRALALVDSVEKHAPYLADIPFQRGRIYAELARLDEAEAQYRQALKINPTYPGVWNNLANTAFRQQKYSESIQFYRRELAAHPDARPWRGIANAYVELGKTDSAQYAFKKALSMDSTFSQAHFGLALLLEDLGDYEGALHYARRAQAHQPDSPEYRYYAGAYLVQLGRLEEAIEMLQPVAEEWPWHQGAHYNIAQALMRLGHTEAARIYQEKAEQLREVQAQISHHENTVRVQPTDPYAHAGLASLYRRVGRYNDAMHAYQVALYLDPNNLDIHNNVAVLHLLRQDTTAAIRTFEWMVQIDTTNLHAWMNLGTLHAMSDHTAEARNAWETALRLDPQNQSIQRSLQRLEARTE